MITSASGQRLVPSSDRLSWVEKPIATGIGNLTLSLNGLLDTGVMHDTANQGISSVEALGSLQVSAKTLLPNRWRVDVTYYGQYMTNEAMDLTLEGASYMGRTLLSVGGVWGTIHAGAVSNVVREQTRRHRGAGNALLMFDDALGAVDPWGVGYNVRFGAWVFSAVVDRNGNVDFGAMYQRPTGTRDYRITLRATDGVYHTDGELIQMESKAVSVVGEIIYGSTVFDIGTGFESLSFFSDFMGANRVYVSSGIQTKSGVITLSVEGHLGRIETNNETSAALGVQYDLARGLSLNLGLNYATSYATVEGVQVTHTEITQGLFSIKYSL